MARTYVIGDIHGANRALLQCLDRSGFNVLDDELICLGDVCDGWPETRQAIDELLRVRHLVYLLGNHDAWALEWMRHGTAEEIWLGQGGHATVQSYQGQVPPASHIDLLASARLYFELDGRLFVHAGFDTAMPIERQDRDTCIWDRNLARMALDFHAKDMETPLTGYRETYIGHTPIPFGKPLCSCGIWLMDTGAGWSGVLSMMDIHSKEIFTSDPVPRLYPGTTGRGHRMS